jgi:hypothetical protein
LSYVPERKNDLKFERAGSGGFEEMKQYLKDDDVKYGVFEVVVKGKHQFHTKSVSFSHLIKQILSGDEYNPVKFVLMTWVGPNVSPGLGKGRCAAHRNELYEFVNVRLVLSCFLILRRLNGLLLEVFLTSIIFFVYLSVLCRVSFQLLESFNPLTETISTLKQLQPSK